MRQHQVRNASQNPDNINGDSEGFFGDGKKLAGARRTVDSSDEYLKCDSLMGGCQGAPIIKNGDVENSFFRLKYKSGSIFDVVNESFAGPHDWFRDMTGSYLPNGNSVNVSGLAYAWDSVKNYALVIPAAPFAVGALVMTTPTAFPTYLNYRYGDY
jgi:hypothetical protein